MSKEFVLLDSISAAAVCVFRFDFKVRQPRIYCCTVFCPIVGSNNHACVVVVVVVVVVGGGGGGSGGDDAATTLDKFGAPLRVRVIWFLCPDASVKVER